MAAKKTTRVGSEKQATSKKTIAGKRANKPGAAKKERMSALEAAAKVLAEAGQPMNTKEMIERMAAKGYWKSPGGKTPAATLYSSISRELENRGKEARFKKVDRGRFALRK